MSKRTVTMKSLLEENVQLKMRVHQLEVALRQSHDATAFRVERLIHGIVKGLKVVRK